MLLLVDQNNDEPSCYFVFSISQNKKRLLNDLCNNSDNNNNVCVHVFTAGEDFAVVQQEIIMMKDCKHSNIVAYFGSYLR